MDAIGWIHDWWLLLRALRTCVSFNYKYQDTKIYIFHHISHLFPNFFFGAIASTPLVQLKTLRKRLKFFSTILRRSQGHACTSLPYLFRSSTCGSTQNCVKSSDPSIVSEFVEEEDSTSDGDEWRLTVRTAPHHPCSLQVVSHPIAPHSVILASHPIDFHVIVLVLP